MGRRPGTGGEYRMTTEAEKEARIRAAAARALAEAAARRAAAAPLQMPRELGGREGPEPTRFGDWERKGIAIDF
ncbi:MAG: DUF1674 domain-containing protein [Alphaproteobacteria bacterium]|nr:MAG: DUF1674 domain-containing protein [Alphaproteobacteria bacterium]